MKALQRIRNFKNSQKVSGTLIVAMAMILPIVAGCSEDAVPVRDSAPPFPPDGVFSITGDGLVTIYWNDNWEIDLAGYDIYRGPEEFGEYTRIGTTGANTTVYEDRDVVNGETWFYAVVAFDEEGNESELSYESVFDTPRPEGFSLVLFDYLGASSAQSGYDFSDVSGIAQAYDAVDTDIYFGNSNGVNYIFAAPGSDIQDYGLIPLIDVDWAPESGWAPSGRVEAIPGHSYIVRVAGVGKNNFAKIYVSSVSPAQVTLDWAYQEVDDSPELSPGGGASR